MKNLKIWYTPYLKDDPTAFLSGFLRVTHWGRVSLYTTLATIGPTPKPWSTAAGTALPLEVNDHQQKLCWLTIRCKSSRLTSAPLIPDSTVFCVYIGGFPGQDSDKPGTSLVDIQCALDNVGASELVIDLIVSTKNDRIFEESILMGIALLRGGNTQIQV